MQLSTTAFHPLRDFLGSNQARPIELSGRVEFLSEVAFVEALQKESRRSERSKAGFLFLRVNVTRLLREQGPSAMTQVTEALMLSSREIDLVGWFETNRIVSIAYLEITRSEENEAEELSLAAQKLLDRVRTVFARTLGIADASKLDISIHTSLELSSAITNREQGDRPSIQELECYPRRSPIQLRLKRFIDLVGSLIILLTISPILILIGIAVKLTSRGPVLFRQTRIGRHGKPFTFLKFRSMTTNNDPKPHEEFVKQFIQQGKTPEHAANGKPIFKIANDPRVTPLGRFLRRTSLDELPQFFNVLKGEMSLVGPRPPIPYETEKYDTWHRRRFSTVKPGMTGLWQVRGRSRTTFDEMVRLDLQYARTWSIWLDTKILAATPLAVIRGEGAR